MDEFGFQDWVKLTLIDPSYYDPAKDKNLAPAINANPKKIILSCKNSELVPIGTTFLNTVRDLKSFPQLILQVSMSSYVVNLHWVEACMIEAGQPYMGMDVMAIGKHAAILKTFTQLRSGERESEYSKRALFTAPKGADFLEDLPTTCHQYIRSIMDFQIVGIWTAFETFAGDLWEKAVNLHPSGLARLQGSWGTPETQRQKKHRRSVALTDANPVKQGDKLMRLEFLEQNGFDVSGLMGTIWRNERFNFQILSSIRDAYIRAFWKDDKDIREAILDSSITSLSAVRNIIIHNDGIVDEDFMESVEGIELFKSSKVGDPLLINGKVVYGLVYPVINASKNLLFGVDEWLKSH